MRRTARVLLAALTIAFVGMAAIPPPADAQTVPPNIPVSGTVYNDLNGNGVRDPGEPGVEGWGVSSFGGPGGNGGGSPVVTDADGNYTLYVHAIGNYNITAQVFPTVEYTDGGPTHNVDVNDESGVSGVTFALHSPGPPPDYPVSGTVYNDYDGDGVHDPAEPGVAGWGVSSFGGPGGNGGGNPVVTDADGNYTLFVHAFGNYNITAQVFPTIEYTDGGPTHNVDVTDASGVSGLTFALHNPTVTFIPVSGTVFNDLDGDGTQDAGEAGIESVGVASFGGPGGNGGGTPVLTDANGDYTLFVHAIGDYNIITTPPTGMTSTTGGATQNVDVPTLSGVSDIDFGYWIPVIPSYPVSGTVFNDLDGDGTQDAGEPGIENVGVSSFGGPGGNGGGTPVLTNVNGDYTLFVHAFGNYNITATPPAGMTSTTGGNVRNVDVTTPAGVSDVDFGYWIPGGGGPEGSTIEYTGDATVTNGESADLSAVLLDESNDPIEGATVELSLGTQSCTDITNATGTASCVIATVAQPVGPATVTVTFDGDDEYAPSSDTEPVVVLPQPPQPTTGSITIVKDALPNSSQDFTFTITKPSSGQPGCTKKKAPKHGSQTCRSGRAARTYGSGGSSSTSEFTLDDDSNPTRSNTKAFAALKPGTYTVSEESTDGWRLTALTCSTGESPSVSNRKVTITLTAGENVVCTFTNTKKSSITIVKDARPNSSRDFSFTTSGSGLSPFSLDDDDHSSLSRSKTFSSLSPGSYSVTEAAASGWALTKLECSSNESVNLASRRVDITLSPGEDVVCTFKNTKLGSITVIEDARPNSSQDFTFSTTGAGLSGFALDDDSNPTLSNTKTFTGLLPGTYSVTQAAVSGWELSGKSCGGHHYSSHASRHVEIELEPGEDVTITFTNTKR